MCVSIDANGLLLKQRKEKHHTWPYNLTLNKLILKVSLPNSNSFPSRSTLNPSEI